MPSNINPYNVDGTFPIAGQDNSSQGFRDNFTNIKNNLIYAETEISDLQAKALVIAPLNSQAFSNDMAGTKITRPQLSGWTQSLVDQGTVTSGTATLDYSIGNFQKITTNQPTIINFSNWPTSIGSNALGYGLIRLWVVVSDVAHTLALPATVTVNSNDIAGLNTTTNVITFDAPGNYIFDFSSSDGGNTYIITDISRNRLTFRDNSFYYNPSVEGSFFIGYNLGLTAAQAIEQSNAKVSVSGVVNSVATGNLSLGTVNSRRIDTGTTAGYSITAARGNLVGNTYSAVRSNDFLGSFSGRAFTGFQNTSNVFQQLSSIGCYATGSNVTFGLGGNIAFFTHRDGDTSTDTVFQAMGIENDQTVNITGAFRTSNIIVEGGTFVYQGNASASMAPFVANSSISTLIVAGPSTNYYLPLTYLEVTLPRNPVNGQTFTISSARSVTTANIFPPNATGGNVAAGLVGVFSSTFSSFNTSVKLTYVSAYNVWFKVE
jgi:hypothetical protein